MLTITPITKQYVTIDVASTLASGAPAVISGVDVALVQPRSAPTGNTAWTSAAYASGTATVLVAGYDADPSGALVVPAGWGAELWIRVVDNPEVTATKAMRIIVEPGADDLPPATSTTPFVQTVAGLSGVVSAPAIVTALGLGNVNNTSDAAKPVSTAQAAALAAKAVIADIPTAGTATGDALRAAFDAVYAPIGAAGGGLTVASSASSAGALLAGKHNPVNASSAPLTMTLPTGTSAKLLSVEKTDSSTNAVTLSGNIRGTASTTISLVWQNEDLLFASDAAGSWWPVAGHKTKTALDAAYGHVVTPERYGAVGNDTADDTAALQAAIAAAQGAQNGVVLLTGNYKITAALTISRPVTIRGSHRSTTQIRQATATENGITLVRDTSAGQSFTRGVRIEGLKLVGAGNGTSTGHAIDGVSGDEIYQGQSLNLRGVTVTGWDIGVRLHRWDNCRFEALGLESSRVGLWIDGNANSNYINASATTCSEAVIRLGDGEGVVLDLNDLINSGQMLDMLTGAQAFMLGGNFESCTGAQAFAHIANGAYLVGNLGRCIKGTGNDVPVFLVENGGGLALTQFPTVAGFTTSKPIKKVNNSAVVSVLHATTNLGAAAQAQVDDAGNTSYPASPWPTRQENAVPTPSANLRNMLLGVMARDSSGVRDRLLFGVKDRGTGADRYTYVDLSRIVTRDDGTSVGTPEAAVYAPQGSLYCRDDPTDAYTALYVKTTAKNVNTGWQPIPNPPGATGPTGPSGSREDDAVNAAGMLAESLPLLTVGSVGTLTAGTIYGVLIGLKAGDVVSKLNVFVTTPAAGTAPTMMKLGLADASGVVVAVTANEASNAGWTLAGGGPVQLSLTAPYTVPSTGGYRIVILQVGSWGTTQVNLLRGNAAGNIQAQPIPGGLRRFGTHGGSQTDLPAVSSSLPSVAGSNINLPWWAAASA